MTSPRSTTSFAPPAGWKLDHIGHAVRTLDEALRHYQSVLHATVIERETVESQGVEVVFLDIGGTCIELLAPTTPASSLNRFLERRGEGLHHICYNVADIRAELARLSTLGIKLIDTTPRPGARHSEIAFLHPSSFHGTLTELSQMPSQGRCAEKD